MIKKIKLILAKWALSGNDIAADDITKILGPDFTKLIDENIALRSESIVKKQMVEFVTNHLTEIMKNTKGLKEFSIELLSAFILANEKLSNLQKDQITAILAGRNNSTDYLQ